MSDDDGYRRSVLRLLEDETLRQTGNRHERLILLGPDGTRLLVKDGSEAGVELTAQEVQRWRGRVDVVTHNHPAGLSFTVGDLLAAIALKVREVNAFTPMLRYRLAVKTGGAWPDGAAALTAIEAGQHLTGVPGTYSAAEREESERRGAR